METLRLCVCAAALVPIAPLPPSGRPACRKRPILQEWKMCVIMCPAWSAHGHTHTHTHVFCVPGSFLQLISLHLLAVDAANVLFTAFPYPSVLCLIPELYFRQKINYFTCELVLNISHVCQTGNRSVEVIQELFYTKNSSDIILGVSSHSHPGIANMFPKCPDDPRRSQHVSQRAVSCVHVFVPERKRKFSRLGVV